MSRLAGPVQQLGIIVSDIDREVDHWTRIGVGPFVMLSRMRFENYLYRGRAMAGPTVSLAISYSGPLQIEIIQQHDDVPSAYTEYLAVSRGGLQHVATWVDTREEYDEKRARLLDQGLTIVHEGNVEGFDARFAYYAPPGQPTFPFYEVSEGNLPLVRPLWAKLRHLVKTWDGTRPVRPVSEVLNLPNPD
ncbi:MAG: VOC family protein [Vicinamibacterales bacterium]